MSSVGDEQRRGGTKPILVNSLNGGSGTSLSVKVHRSYIIHAGLFCEKD